MKESHEKSLNQEISGFDWTRRFRGHYEISLSPYNLIQTQKFRKYGTILYIEQ